MSMASQAAESARQTALLPCMWQLLVALELQVWPPSSLWLPSLNCSLNFSVRRLGRNTKCGVMVGTWRLPTHKGCQLARTLLALLLLLLLLLLQLLLPTRFLLLLSSFELRSPLAREYAARNWRVDTLSQRVGCPLPSPLSLCQGGVKWLGVDASPVPSKSFHHEGPLLVAISHDLFCHLAKQISMASQR